MFSAYSISTTPFLRLVGLLLSLFLAVINNNVASAGSNALAVSSPTEQVIADCTIVINEFMSAKQRILADEDGEYSDWIELYNCTDYEINLDGWHLSDQYGNPDQWTFPTVTLPSKGFLIVWASGKDRTRVGKPLHTNFKIAAKGEPLVLTHADGTTIDDIAPIILNKHEVAGRYPDGFGEFAILAVPTPNTKNEFPIASARLEAPSFSVKSGFYDKPFKLVLSHPDEDAIIYYTLDGSEPDPDNLLGSTYQYKNEYQAPLEEGDKKLIIKDNFLQNEYVTHKYNKPIAIKDRSWEPDRISQISTTFDKQPSYFPEPKVAKHWQNSLVTQANRLIKEINRAIRRINHFGNRALRKYHYVRTNEVRPVGQRRFVGYLPEISWRKYRYSFKGTPVRAIAVKDKDNRRTISPIATHTYFVGERSRYNLPIIALTIPEKDLFDYEQGIMVAGKDYDEWLADNNSEPKELFEWTPANWHRKSDDTDKVLGNLVLLNNQNIKQADASYRIHGGGSRGRAGNKSIRVYLDDSDIFNNFFSDDEQNLRLNLRNTIDGGGGRSFLVDPVFQKLSSGLAFATQRSKPILVFINGEFFSLYFATERKDHYWISSQFNVSKDEIDLLKTDAEADKGRPDEFLSFLERVESWDPANGDLYPYLQENMDLASFIDYFATEIYSANADWPHNNIAYWRYSGDTNTNDTVRDGRWRWIMYDMDTTMGTGGSIPVPDYPALEVAAGDIIPEHIPERAWAMDLFSKALDDERFRKRFITRLSDLLNTAFVPERAKNIVSEQAQQIRETIPKQIQRWNKPKSMQEWRHDIEAMNEFFDVRPDIQRKQLRDYFDLEDLYEITVDINDEIMGSVKLNTLHLGKKGHELASPVAANTQLSKVADVLAFPWQGKYFKELPLKLKAISKPGYEFSHWTIHQFSSDKTYATSTNTKRRITLYPKNDVYVQAVYRPIEK